MVNGKNAWQYSGLVSIRTALQSQCCTALCSGKACLEASSDRCIKSNNNTYVIVLQTLSGRLFCVVVGHLVPFLLFTTWPETTFSPLVLKVGKRFQTRTISHHQKEFSQMKRAQVRAHKHTHRNGNILHIP